MAIRTVLDIYRCDTEVQRPRHYLYFTPEDQTAFSTEEFFGRTVALAESLSSMGVDSGDRVMLMSDNRPEWHMADLAILDLGAADVPVYGTLTPEQIAYQARDSGAKAAIVDTPEQMEKFLEIQETCPDLKLLVQIEGEHEEGVVSMDDMVTAGSVASADSLFWDRAACIDPKRLMTLIYTSGTTGEPKGVMLTHDNMIQNVLNSAHRIPVKRDDVALEFLPLCHVLERMIGYIYMWRSTYRAYCSVYHVGDLLTTIQPTLFAGVPRFYEKVQQKILTAVESSGPVKRALFKWALEVGRDVSRRTIVGREIPGTLARRHKLADKLVLSKVREGLGGRVNYAISGGAELGVYVNEFFQALGVRLMEGYGLTETSPVISVNGAGTGDLRLGTVGKVLDNLEVRIAGDGELCVKGPSVMKGYWNKPEQTAEVFDEDGFFHTGDIAEIDDDGFILIVDRKKDLIVTAGGKNVAPQPIESHMKQSPFVEAAVLVGDRRPFIVTLFSPAFEELERWAGENGIEFSSPDELIRNPEIDQLFADIVERENAVLAKYEQIKKYHVLTEPLSIEGGHLTPTLKVKRRVVEQVFAKTIEDLYF